MGNLHQFSCILPRPPHVVLRYVMYFLFRGWRHNAGRIARQMYLWATIEHNTHYSRYSKQSLLNHKHQQVLVVKLYAGSKSAIYNCFVYCTVCHSADRLRCSRFCCHYELHRSRPCKNDYQFYTLIRPSLHISYFLTSYSYSSIKIAFMSMSVSLSVCMSVRVIKEKWLELSTLQSVAIYTVIHNYGNPQEKWNIFVAWAHLWLKLGMVKPEIMLCEFIHVTLRYVTAQYPVTWRHFIGLVRQLSC